MIKSMTGYGRCERQTETRTITAEIKSVNHRFFEFAARVPRSQGFLEEKLKSFLQDKISRGKVEVSIGIQSSGEASTDVTVNEALARAYVDALRKMGTQFNLQDDLTLTAISRFSDIFSVQRLSEDEDEVWQEVRAVTEEALERFSAMRATEGARLRDDLLARMDSIAAGVAIVCEQSPRTVAAYRERLTAKIRETLADRQIDDARIVTETAIFADRVAVDEETVRLKSHLQQFRDILDGGGAIGRKLDFLVQEINREINTIGSKAQDADIARVVVDMKSDVEKIREQIQNIE